jgi:Na+-transporting NADH:ubiquinone oxidoreductase subunit A
MITHKIKNGFDLRLVGRSERELVDAPDPVVVAVQGDDFPGIKPKLTVSEGDAVKTGEPLFYDKRDPDRQFVSPATGTVSRIVLGPRRKLERVEITPGTQDEFFDVPHVPDDKLGSVSREDLVRALKGAGLWSLIRQRPIGKTPDGAKVPVAVFVNGMDTEPLAADPAFAVQGQRDDLQAGIDVLRALTEGTVYLTVRPGSQPAEFQSLQGVEMHAFDGPHPAGLVGTHLHEIRPLHLGETVWYLKAQEAVLLGRWARTGHYPAMRVVALAGDGVQGTRYYRVRHGASIVTLTGGKPIDDSMRVISGTVLSGDAVGPTGFLGYYAHTVTIIPDGKGDRDLFGWAVPKTGKLTASRAVFPLLGSGKAYRADARLNGGHRPMVNIGQWETITPLDIYPSFLIRAIQANDLEEALKLGLLEVTEEDVALCTVVDPCKTDVGAVVRQGLDLFEAEG